MAIPPRAIPLAGGLRRVTVESRSPEDPMPGIAFPFAGAPGALRIGDCVRPGGDFANATIRPFGWAPRGLVREFRFFGAGAPPGLNGRFAAAAAAAVRLLSSGDEVEISGGEPAYDADTMYLTARIRYRGAPVIGGGSGAKVCTSRFFLFAVPLGCGIRAGFYYLPESDLKPRFPVQEDSEKSAILGSYTKIFTEGVEFGKRLSLSIVGWGMTIVWEFAISQLSAAGGASLAITFVGLWEWNDAIVLKMSQGRIYAKRCAAQFDSRKGLQKLEHAIWSCWSGAKLVSDHISTLATNVYVDEADNVWLVQPYVGRSRAFRITIHAPDLTEAAIVRYEDFPGLDFPLAGFQCVKPPGATGILVRFDPAGETFGSPAPDPAPFESLPVVGHTSTLDGVERRLEPRSVRKNFARYYWIEISGGE